MMHRKRSQCGCILIAAGIGMLVGCLLGSVWLVFLIAVISLALGFSSL